MKRPPRTPTEYWVAYSDVLGNLLLVFVLVLVTAMANLGEQVTQLDASRSALNARENDLRERTARLSVANRGLSDRDLALAALRDSVSVRDRELAAARALLEATHAKLSGAESALTTRERDLLDARAATVQSAARADATSRDLELVRHDLARTFAELAIARTNLTTTLHDLTASLAAASEEREKSELLGKQLNDMIGVRRSIVESLERTLGRTSSLAIDGATGAVRLGEAVLFDEGKDVLRPESAPVLRGFLEQYLASLLGNPANRAHVAQIEIEGHTNDNGTFEANLDLSYKRARAVLAFLLAQRFPSSDDLRALVKISGRSFSDPVRTPDGKVDKARSRRIEIKFRLKDEGGR